MFVPRAYTRGYANIAPSGLPPFCSVSSPVSPLSVIRSSLFAIRSLLSVIRSPLSALFFPLFALRYSLFALRFPFSVFRFPLSAFRARPCAATNIPVTNIIELNIRYSIITSSFTFLGGKLRSTMALVGQTSTHLRQSLHLSSWINARLLFVVMAS